jgi:putative hydrolase of the HAD superfamily
VADARIRPQFFYFDLGNVLLYFDHLRAARQMAEVAGLTEAEVWATVFDSDLEIRYERGDLDCQGFYREFCERTGARPDFEQLRLAAAAIFDVNESIVPLVRSLHRAEKPLGILSNTCAAHWDYCLDGRYAFLCECFTVHALSYKLGAMKPDPAIYVRAAELAGVPPQCIFFTDDRPENVAGALAAGYDAVLFEGAEKLREALEQRGVWGE